YAHHGFEDRKYHGEIIVAVDPNAKLTVVNRLSAEKMLQGIVPSEIFPSAPLAALEAQAITARSELLAKIGVHNRANPFLVCATQMCQVYGGINKETPGTNDAIQKTRGLMLFDEKGHLVDSVYHADSGGYTEHNEYVWPGSPNPNLRGKQDAPKGTPLPWKPGEIPTEEQIRTFLTEPSVSYASETRFANKVHRWVREYTQDKLNQLVNDKHDIGPVHTVEAVVRGVSGRVKSVRFIGVSGEVVVERELRVRRLLNNLRSGLFVVDHLEDGTWRFTGGGYGHGVGMSQYGAIGMAEKGASAKKILQHYYSGAKVGSVY
ncbi:MAG: SpoIID/LytB domain-containing protein, partial [Myxococcota bacterium]|nr:SpoIID/LytB domain-containing protein [Myxococcota bacterium]